MINNTFHKVITIPLMNEKASQDLAQSMASSLKEPVIITLSGEIGTGKTTIVRAILKSLGVQSAIKSPTFSLVESYQSAHLSIHHFDLYRIQQEEELEYLGFRDYFSNDSICFIEWPEHARDSLPVADVHLNLTINGIGRDVQIQALSKAGCIVLESIT